MHRNNLNKLLVVILILLAFFSFYITRYSLQRVTGLSPEDSRRIAELEDVIERLQKQIFAAETKEKSLRNEIDNVEAKTREKNKLHQDFANPQKDEKIEQSGSENLFTCQQIDNIKIKKTIAQGYTKKVQEGVFKGQRVAVKSATNEAKSVKDCLEGGVHKKDGECYLLANYKVLKEIMVLRQLRHRHIAGLLGMCVRSESSSPVITERGVTMVVEIGETVQLHKLMEKAWPFRVQWKKGVGLQMDAAFCFNGQIAVQLAALLDYLSNSSMGSIALTDVRDEQFIMVGDTIKLSDLDDIHATEPNCNVAMKCPFKKKETGIKCQSNMKCAGMNAYSNMHIMAEVFLSPLLNEGCPAEKKTDVDSILNKIMKGEIDAESLERKLEDLLE